MSYIIYGKATERIVTNKGIMEPHSRFAALDYQGNRVAKLSDAKYYDTEEEAQAVIDAKGRKSCVAFEIRKAK